MGPDEFSDPIVIPITITIPDPRPRGRGGRWDLGPSHHPSFTDPGWFRRQREPSRYTLAQLVMPIPLPPPVVLPRSGDEARAIIRELQADWARARRRAGRIEDEIGQGDYGSAASHLFLHKSYPTEVDDPFVVNNEAEHSPALDALIDTTAKDLKKRLDDPLDERHREDTRNDQAGNPVIDSRGRIRRHDEEVATNAAGLEDRADALDAKAKHYEDNVDPPPKASIEAARALSDKIRSILSYFNMDIPGLGKLREEVLTTGTNKRPGMGPSS